MEGRWFVLAVVVIAVTWCFPLPVRGADGDTSDQDFNARDCQDHRANGERENKVYRIYLPGNSILVYCEGMTENSPDETAWTVIQRRRDGPEDFNKSWRHYSRGFGSRETDHWIGNENLHLLTTAGPRYVLRIELWSYDDPSDHRYADYDGFKVGSQADWYKLHYTNYSGDAGDSLRFQKGMNFSTPDQDNDQWGMSSCAQMLDSGWWFSDCGSANLNGQFYRGDFDPARDGPYRGGIWWFGMGDMFYSFRSLMKIRPVGDDYVPPGIIA